MNCLEEFDFYSCVYCLKSLETWFMPMHFIGAVVLSVLKICRDAIMQQLVSTKDSVIDLLTDGYQR